MSLFDTQPGLTALMAAERDGIRERRGAAGSMHECYAYIQDAVEEAAAARRDLQELKDNPQVPKEIMEKLRGQFAQAAEAAEKRVAELEARLKTADPTVAVFKVHFEAIQREFSTMLALINSAPAETGAKLRTAAAAVLDKFVKEVSADEA